MQWEESDVKNSSIDPNTKPLGFHLLPFLRITPDRIPIVQRKCDYPLHKLGLSDLPVCTCGAVKTVKSIVLKCSQTKFKRGVENIHNCNVDTINCLREMYVRLLTFSTYNTSLPTPFSISNYCYYSLFHVICIAPI